jgi:dimethylhistidine N-methyltransferase
MSIKALKAFHDFEPAVDDFGVAVLRGLSQTPKTLPCKFFYDEVGSQLFEEICDLDEYYPTRTEIGLLKSHAPEIAQMIGGGAHLVEFGSGGSIKVRILIDALDHMSSYVPIDISRDHLVQAAAGLARDHLDVPVVAVCADYTDDMDLPDLGEGPRIGFFPGSTIGNFTPKEAVEFLSNAHDWLLGGGLVIGVDLMKDEVILKAAYDDAKGITAAFNKNILVRCNAELGGTFDLENFEHRATVNHEKGRVEMHLVSTRDQLVRVSGRTFSFRSGETIHTENSHKFTIEGFHALAEEAGFIPARHWVDDRQLFSVHFLEAR